jgi:hypothetical protein
MSVESGLRLACWDDYDPAPRHDMNGHRSEMVIILCPFALYVFWRRGTDYNGLFCSGMLYMNRWVRNRAKIATLPDDQQIKCNVHEAAFNSGGGLYT